MSTLQKKISISAFSALLFILVSLPHTYNITNSLTHLELYDINKACPTNKGLLLHTLVFFLLTYLSMWNAPQPSALKLKFSIYGTLIFYFISSPSVYSFVNSVLGNSFATAAGCPTIKGILLHALLFCLALIGVMYLPDL